MIEVCRLLRHGLLALVIACAGLALVQVTTCTLAPTFWACRR